MGETDKTEMSERELEELRLRRLNALRGVAQVAARRWLWAFLAATVLVSAALVALLARRTLRAPDRATIVTRLQFFPKRASRIQAMDAGQVIQILTRDSLVRRYADSMGFSGLERLRTWIDISIAPSRFDARLFEITARANTEKRAAEKANRFADACLGEYEEYRRAELEKWLTTVDARRRELQGQIDAIDAEERQLAGTNGLFSPKTDGDRLRVTITEQKFRLSEADVKVTNEALRARRLREELGDVSAKAFGRADELRALQDALVRAEKEVARLRTLYTDRNPRLALALKSQAEAAAELDAFLKENEMPAMTSSELERLTRVYARLKDAEVEHEIQMSSQAALKAEIAANEARLASFARLLPQFDALARRRDTLQAAIDGLEETISDIRYLQAAVSGDLAQVERATSGRVAPPLSKKNVALGVAGGLFAGGGLWALLVLLDILFGRVRGAREVACYLGVRSLGALDRKGRLPAGVDHRDALDRVCYRIERETVGKAVVFAGLLPGGRFVPELGDAMRWSLAMSGRRVVTVDIVPARSFEAPEGAEQLSSVCLKGDRGWFARVSRYALSPSETKLLGEDIATLRSRYDLVILRCLEPIHSAIFLRQALGLGESAMFYVGSRRTPRLFLRRLSREGERTGRQPLVVVGGRLAAGDFTEEAS